MSERRSRKYARRGAKGGLIGAALLGIASLINPEVGVAIHGGVQSLCEQVVPHGE